MIITQGSKLSEQDVLKIHEEAKAGTSQAEIARRYGVTGSLISRLLNGYVWRRLHPEFNDSAPNSTRRTMPACRRSERSV